MISPAKYIGQKLAVTGPDSGQCTAIAHAWERDNNLPIVFGDAKDTYANATAYERLPYTPGVIPPASCVVVWNGTWGGGAGHTAWVESADAAGFTAISQNDPTGSVVIRKRYAYSNAITGFFYPKGDNMPVSDAELADLKEWKRKAIDELTPALADALEWKRKAISELQPEIDRLNKQLGDQATELKPGVYRVK